MPPEVNDGLRSSFEYVLIASADLSQAGKWLAAVGALGAETRVVRDGARGVEVLQRVGAPILLITDLLLPQGDGFALVEELRRRADPADSVVIGLSPFHEIRELAQTRRDLAFTAVLPVEALDALSLAAERAVRLVRRQEPSQSLAIPSADQFSIEAAMRDVADEAARVTGAPGAVVYLRAGSAERFRANLTWISENAERSPLSAREVFRPILEAVRGVSATPITSDGGPAIGVLCVFDVEPLALGASEADALRALGQRAGERLQNLLNLPAPERREFALPPAPALTSADLATLSRLALADPLTGLANRRGGELSIDREVARARREGRPLSVLFLDVDRFKVINDVDGHLVGDHVLRSISETLTRVLRRSDLAIRWGGEEFLIILPNVGLTQARHVAERVRVTMQEVRIDRSRVTVSGGVVEMAQDEDFTAALKRADEQLRAAKQRGRNRIC